jgi:hypothetical protein
MYGDAYGFHGIKVGIVVAEFGVGENSIQRLGQRLFNCIIAKYLIQEAVGQI